jgi:hypothetical protein
VYIDVPDAKLGRQVSLIEATYAAANVGSSCPLDLEPSRSATFIDLSNSVDVAELDGFPVDKNESLGGLEV